MEDREGLLCGREGIVGQIGDNLRMTCAFPEESKKLCPREYLGMLCSKIAGTTTSLQWFPLKNGKFYCLFSNVKSTELQWDIGL